MPESKERSELQELTKYLKANLLLQLRNFDSNENEKPEILLFRAGFTRQEIADLLGKNYEAVKKSLQSLKKDGREDEE